MYKVKEERRWNLNKSLLWTEMILFLNRSHCYNDARWYKYRERTESCNLVMWLNSLISLEAWCWWMKSVAWSRLQSWYPSPAPITASWLLDVWAMIDVRDVKENNLFQVERSGTVFSDFPVIEVKRALCTLNKQVQDMRYDSSSIRA